MKQLDYILANEPEVLHFLKSRYPMYHLSNFFFRDIQYGIQTMLDQKSMSVGYADAERIARDFTAQLEKKKILNPIDKQSWVVNYPEFKKPNVTPVVAAKPAAKPAAPAAAAPGVGKPSLPPLSRPAAGAPKPGGLPPLSRPAAGATPTAKPGGLPPLKSAAVATSKPPAPGPITSPAPVETPAPAATSPAVDGPNQAAAPSPPTPTAKPAAPGQKRPLPPLRSSTPAGKK